MENQENVENVSTNVETEPQSNFDAKQIRKATEDKILRRLGVDNFEDIEGRLKSLNELEEAKKSEDTKLAEAREQVEKELENNRQEARELAKANDLRKMGVSEEQLEDALRLTSGLELEQVKEKVDNYFGNYVENTGTNTTASAVDEYEIFRQQASSYKPVF